VSLNVPLQRVPYGFRPVLSAIACYRQPTLRVWHNLASNFGLVRKDSFNVPTWADVLCCGADSVDLGFARTLSANESTGVRCSPLATSGRCCD